MKRLIPSLLVLLLAVLACSLPGLPVEIPPATEPEATPATAEPVAPPVEPPALIPSGFISAPDTSTILFHNPDGVITGSLAIGESGSQSVHVAGGTSGGIPPVIYFSWSGTGQVIQNIGGVENVLVDGVEFFRLGGAEASPWFAYTTVSYVDTGLLTRMYIGTPATIASAAPVVDFVAEDYQALKPLALRMMGGEPTGVWYTGCMYGIGGDLVFDPCNRLTFLDLGTGVSTEVIGDGFNPSKLSPDRTWVAYAQHGGGMPLVILNLETGENHTFPAWAENDRGSGDGIFTPDSSLVAWMEGSGYRMDDPITFHSLLRIGTTGGALVADFQAADFNAVAGFEVMWASPVGWLDNDSLLIQIGGLDWHNDAIIRLDLPGSLFLVSNGNFIDLTYP